VEVADTVGAGDSYTAAVIAGLLAGEELPAIAKKAAAVSAFVCTQPGATPEVPQAVLDGEL
jgi:fructokinase